MKNLIIFFIAIVIALFAALLAYSHLQKKTKSQVELYKEQTVSVAVATQDLSWGTLITKEMTKVVPYLKKSLPSGYFSDPANLKGRTIIYPIKVNEPIFESRLAPITFETGGIAAVINPEKRAMAIKVDKVIGNTGFIKPGNRVDVLVSLSKKKDVDNPITKTVLENILVLATGHKMGKKDGKEKPTKMDVVTLEVDPEEAEKLALASTQGKIQLALRNFADTKDVITNGSTIPGLLSSYRGGKEVGTQKSPSVELIKGSQVSISYF
ncbi:MAG: Flp pilus assembly protein CpaB [Candidatus Scalinduaceae bacterium]